MAVSFTGRDKAVPEGRHIPAQALPFQDLALTLTLKVHLEGCFKKLRFGPIAASVPPDTSEKRCLATGQRQAEVFVGQPGGYAPSRSAIQKADLD